MKKIPSLFVREEHGRLSTTLVNPECQWVIDGEGKAYAKLDGTSCMVLDNKLYKRYDNSSVRFGFRKQNTTPLKTWIHCECPTERGQFIYWIPIGTKDYYHQIGWAWSQGKLEDGTYELVGPGVQNNPHGYEHCTLVKHNSMPVKLPVFCKEDAHFQINCFLEDDKQKDLEGIVWHHPDGRMCKITKKKFGIDWN